jgi:hypothetical protein
MMAFKPATEAAEIERLIGHYRSLPGEIQTMKHFEWGPEGGVSTNTEGFTHCFISTFEKLDHVRDYGPHAAHRAFVEALQPSLQKILVFDFEIQ